MKCPNKNKYCKAQLITKDPTNGNFFCSGHNSKPDYKVDIIKLCAKSNVSKSTQEMTPSEALSIALILLMAVFNLDLTFKERK